MINFAIATLLATTQPKKPINEWVGHSIVQLEPAPKPLASFQATEVAEVVIEPAPTPKPVIEAPGGCVVGYSTGNSALNQIIAHESGGRSCATNPGGCFGLLQACPGAPLKAACGGNPECQIAWFQANKTGGRSWEEIWGYWQAHGYW